MHFQGWRMKLKIQTREPICIYRVGLTTTAVAAFALTLRVCVMSKEKVQSPQRMSKKDSLDNIQYCFQCWDCCLLLRNSSGKMPLLVYEWETCKWSAINTKINSLIWYFWIFFLFTRLYLLLSLHLWKWPFKIIVIVLIIIIIIILSKSLVSWLELGQHIKGIKLTQC